jgi:hypothetical protein
MRNILMAAAAAAALLVATTPAAVTLAADNSAAIPLQCSLPETKTDHPDWFRKGGYCTVFFVQTDHYTGPDDECEWEWTL